MRKYTLRELRELVRLGMAVNITEADPKSIKEPVEKIGYSSGVYGLNGGLLQGREYRELLRMREEITAEMEALSDKIKAAMGDHETIVAGEYKVSYKTVQSSRLDTTAIKARFPELVQQFMKTVTCKRFTIS